MDVKLEDQVRGTRLLVGDTANLRRTIISTCIQEANARAFQEVFLPSLEPFSIYEKKTGPEIESQMYVFPDRKDRKLCLRPEGTATIQALAREKFQGRKDVRLWYECRCWRYERPQAGRYREFTQFGMEWLYPRDLAEAKATLIDAAKRIVVESTPKSFDFKIDETVKRGLSYYVEDGFEISIPLLGAQKQVVGGGRYPEGIGFAVGIDRLMQTWVKPGGEPS